MANPVLTALFEHKAWCNQGLVEALRAAPADADRRQMSVILYTFDHTSIVDQIFKARLAGEPHEFQSVVAAQRPDLEALARTLADTDAWYLDYIRQLAAAELDSVVDFTFVADGEAGRMTRAQILAHVIAHGAAHRGAIGKMLETLDIPGPPDMVTSLVGHQLAAGAAVA